MKNSISSLVSRFRSNRSLIVGSRIQWIVGAEIWLIMFVTGLAIGWSSPYLARLASEESSITMSSDQLSSLASMLLLGRFVGSLVSAISLEFIGGKRLLLTNGFPTLISWILLIFADSPGWLYSGRFLGGTCLGVVSGCFPLFIGEIAIPELRGRLVFFAVLGSTLGVVIGNAMGAIIDISRFSLISAVPTIGYVILFGLIPESPHHLVRVGRTEEAIAAIAIYNSKIDPKIELESLKIFHDNARSESYFRRAKRFVESSNRKVIGIVVASYVFTQLSGMSLIETYMETILRDARCYLLEPSKMVVIVNLFGIPGGIGGMFLADRFGRRVLMLVSSLGTFISVLGMATHFELLKLGYDSKRLEWLPVISLVGISKFVYVGLNTVPSILLGELFPPEIKIIASCFANVFSSLFGYLVVFSFRPVLGILGYANLFYFIGFAMICSALFSLFVLPETKGKTLREIQNIIAKIDE